MSNTDTTLEETVAELFEGFAHNEDGRADEEVRGIKRRDGGRRFNAMRKAKKVVDLFQSELSKKDEEWRDKIRNLRLEKSGVPNLETYMWGTNFETIKDIKRYNELVEKFNGRLDALLKEGDKA